MSLQIVIMNTLIAIIKVEQFVDSIPGCSHLYRMVGRQPGDSKVDDYPSAGQEGRTWQKMSARPAVSQDPRRRDLPSPRLLSAD